MQLTDEQKRMLLEAADITSWYAEDRTHSASRVKYLGKVVKLLESLADREGHTLT